MEGYVGCLVSVDCGPQGVYQGRIAAYDVELGTIQLRKPFKNGKPTPQSSHTIAAGDIMDLVVLELGTEVSNVGSPMVISQPRRSFTPPPTSSSPRLPQSIRFKPVGVKNLPTHNVSSTSRRRAKSTSGMKNCAEFEAELFGLLEGGRVKLKGKAAKDTHLMVPLDAEVMAEDFDFEANLALFDKKTMMASLSHQNPLISANPSDQNFRHDENVIQDSKRVTSWLSKGEAPFSVHISSALDSSSDSLTPNPPFQDPAKAKAGRKTWLGPSGELVGVQAWEEKAESATKVWLGPAGVAASLASALRFVIRRRLLDENVELKGRCGQVILGLGKGELCRTLVGSLAQGLVCGVGESMEISAAFPASTEPLPDLGPSVRVSTRGSKSGLPKVREVELLVLVGASLGPASPLDPILCEWVRAAAENAALVVLLEMPDSLLPSPLPESPLRLYLNAPSIPPSPTAFQGHTALVHSPLLPTSAATAQLFVSRPFVFLH